jgi:hypothetical protein
VRFAVDSASIRFSIYGRPGHRPPLEELLDATSTLRDAMRHELGLR